MCVFVCVLIAARQMGFEDAGEVAELCRLAEEYLRKSKECEESIYEYLANAIGMDTDSLYVKLIDEFERCILSYFAFHWNHASYVISQVCYPLICFIFYYYYYYSTQFIYFCHSLYISFFFSNLSWKKSKFINSNFVNYCCNFFSFWMLKSTTIMFSHHFYYIILTLFF